MEDVKRGKRIVVVCSDCGKEYYKTRYDATHRPGTGLCKSCILVARHVAQGHGGPTKVCRACEQVLPRSAFSGRAARCKACQRAERAAQRPPPVVEVARVCRLCGDTQPLAAFPTLRGQPYGHRCRACVAAQQRAARIPHPRPRRMVSREERRAYRRTHYAQHQELYYAASRRRRALKRNAPQVERVYRRIVFRRDNYTCYLCGKVLDPNTPPGQLASPTLDHVVPLNKGGSHTYDNLRTACNSCNARKRDRLLEGLTP